MDWDDYEGWGKKISTWGASYHKALRDYSVRSQIKPGEILNKLDTSPPEEGAKMEDIMKDFNDIVMPGMTHWQHPRFFAYFPSNASPLLSLPIFWLLQWQHNACFGKHHLRQLRWKRG